jgi:hypothetical protein
MANCGCTSPADFHRLSGGLAKAHSPEGQAERCDQRGTADAAHKKVRAPYSNVEAKAGKGHGGQRGDDKQVEDRESRAFHAAIILAGCTAAATQQKTGSQSRP